MDKWFLIVNPHAGNRSAGRRWSVIEKILQELEFSYHVSFTTHSWHASDLAKKAILRGYRQIMAVGGDGTMHEVINGICDQTIIPVQDILFTLLPIGTGNDWIKTYRIPTDTRRYLQMVKEKNYFLQDIGRVEYQAEGIKRSRYFSNVAGLAYDAYVLKLSQDSHPRIFSALFYLYFILKGLFRYRLKWIRIILDGKELVDRFNTINVGICKYSGGGLQLVPHADPGDSFLAVTTAARVSKLGIIANLIRFYNGTIQNHPKVNIYSVRNLKIYSRDNEQIELEADGEFLGYTPVEFSILPKTLKIIVPKVRFERQKNK